jgi:hypothetical protein
MQSVLPRRNLNTDFDIVNALIQSPSSQSALRSPGGRQVLPSSVVHGGNFSPRRTSSARGSSWMQPLSPGASSVLSSTSSTASGMSTLSASFRRQLPGSFASSSTRGHRDDAAAMDRREAKRLRRIAKTAAAGKAVASAAAGGLDIAEVNAWAQHSRQAIGRCAILLHLLLDLMQQPQASLAANPTYHSICDEWQELGFIFYDTDTSLLPPTTSSSSLSTAAVNGRQSTNGLAVKPFPGLDEAGAPSTIDDGAAAAASRRFQEHRLQLFHFAASVPRPDFLSRGMDNDAAAAGGDDEEATWPTSLIMAKAFGLDVTRADCEALWQQLSDYHQLFIQLKSVLDLVTSPAMQAAMAPGSVSALIQRVLQTPLGQRVREHSGIQL